MLHQVVYKPTNFQLNSCSNEENMPFQMKIPMLTQFQDCFKQAPLFATMSSVYSLGFVISLLDNCILSQNTFLIVLKFFFIHESIIRRKEVECHCPVAIAQVRCPNCWASLNLHIESLYIIYLNHCVFQYSLQLA